MREIPLSFWKNVWYSTSGRRYFICGEDRSREFTQCRMSRCEHSVAKIPVQFAVGQRELESRTVAIRRLGSKKQEVMSLDDAIAALQAEIESRGNSD